MAVLLVTSMALSPNTRLGRYEIRSQLGAGGMGEVYLAKDTQLNRTIALKILPADVARDGQRMHRFLQEAQAASSLNHSNVAHIYEIGEASGTHFIAMEYVEGQSLDARIGGRPLVAEEIMEISLQIADALDEAHAKGITHRDIKPSNIMITPRGGVKVLDFGLAKVTEPAQSAQNVDSELATRVKTSPGMVMGTVNYMSPEQALGRSLDHRTDIFSLGVVLYEMSTGRLPFTGESVTDTIDRIAHAQPEAIARLNYNIPPELEGIIKKALRKDKGERYQTAGDMLADLKSLKRELEFASQLERSASPESKSAMVASPGGGQGTSAIYSKAAPSTADVDASHLTRSTSGIVPTHAPSSAEYLLGEVKRHKTGVFLALIGITILIIASIGLYKFVNWSGSAPSVPFQATKMTKLTSNGKATQAVISPDGKQVVYVIDDGGRRSLWLRQVATAGDVQLTAPDNVFYNGLTISRDGNFLYYVSGGGGSDQNRALYQMPVLGGNPKKVVEDVGSTFSLSPDSKRFAFVRGRQRESVLMIANADGTEERKIATRYVTGVAWSPDGKRIASIAINTDSVGRFMNVIEIPVEGGTERPLTSKRWSLIQRLAWLADGSGLVMTAAEQVADIRTQQIWHLSYASGEARKVTNDLNNYGSISLNADSSVLVTVQEDRTANIWIAPNGDASRATQITSVTGRGEGALGVAWMPDGKIVYHSMAGGKEGIWMMEADGKNRRQLTTVETVDTSPSASADGRYIVFLSERAGTQNVWRMDIDGSNPKRLTNTMGSHASPTLDNQVIYQTGGSRVILLKVSMDGGEPVKIGERMRWAVISPDGKLIACSFETPGSPAKLAVVPIEGGSPIKVFDAQLDQPARIRWTPDGRALTYVASQNGISDIWSQPIDGDEPKKLTDFKADEIFSYDWSRDNKLVISHGTSVSDVVLIRNVK